jgi:hypothetical protein
MNSGAFDRIVRSGLNVRFVLKPMSGLRFLSPENILFSYVGSICISVVDLCGIENHRVNLESWEYVRYSSPEMMSGEISEAREKNVMFSLGMRMHLILNPSIPFSGMSPEIAGKMIMSGERPSMEKISENHSEWVGFIENCWMMEKKERPGFGQFEEEIVILSPKVLDKMEKKKTEKVVQVKDKKAAKVTSSSKSTAKTPTVE